MTLQPRMTSLFKYYTIIITQLVLLRNNRLAISSLISTACEQ